VAVDEESGRMIRLIELQRHRLSSTATLRLDRNSVPTHKQLRIFAMVLLFVTVLLCLLLCLGTVLPLYSFQLALRTFGFLYLPIKLTPARFADGPDSPLATMQNE
jgi:hypothetical protein